jgi:hypothetical protein
MHARRVRDHKARNNIASAVICMSIAGPRSASLNDAIEAAIKAGIVVITAAGEDSVSDGRKFNFCTVQLTAEQAAAAVSDVG